jgi:glucokinase
MLLAGDVGGTKTLLGIFARAPERPTPIETGEFRTLEYDSLGDMIAEFLSTRRDKAERVEAASFGVAGVVIDEVATLTNVPWTVDAAEIRSRFNARRTAVLNDLIVLGYGVTVLEPRELAVLQEGEAAPDGNAAIIAAGTGLGTGMLHNVDGRFIPSPSEGGHADFAARKPREMELVLELTRIYGRTHTEHVISGLGLTNLFRFTHPNGCEVVPKACDPAEIPALLSASAMAGRCPACVDAFDMFIEAYGAEAGNLALRFLATAGVYVGGGIAPKILPALRGGAFIEAFRSKEPMADLLATVPVWVIMNPHAGLLGAAVYANTL